MYPVEILCKQAQVVESGETSKHMPDSLRCRIYLDARGGGQSNRIPRDTHAK